jgi:tetratricopeptide (TPR) repeat protein
MPTTINGIGTRYSGRSNLSVRAGRCHSCHRDGMLESYDTRLWFVILYIPLIPLGKKRITDCCPRCRRHFAADQAQYEEYRRNLILTLRDSFQMNASPEAAIAVHGEMLGLHAQDASKSFREEALAKYPQHGLMAATFAAQLDQMSQPDVAADLYRCAYELDPKMPLARDGMARLLIADGKLDESRRLTSYLEQPGASQNYSLVPLERLADAYQKAGRHEEMLEICEHLLRELPAIGHQYQFRNFVGKSEQAAHRVKSVLPERTSFWLGMLGMGSDYSPKQKISFWLAAAAVTSVVVMAGVNEYYREHRTVGVRNEFGPKAKVVIDGTLALPPENFAKIGLAEGTHHVAVSGKLNEEFDVDITTSYWQRWTYEPAWVINIGGASQLVERTAIYAKNPPPTEAKLTAGDNLFFASQIDYLFSNPPNSMHVDNSSAQIKKEQLSVGNEQIGDVFSYLLGRQSRPAAFHYAESWLLINPNDNDLLNSYFRAIGDEPERELAKAFLRGQLAQRPIFVNWHRCYQELHKTAAERGKLVTQYDALLAAEPKNAALLYLRGRLSLSSGESRSFYERSMAADPGFSWPWVALGYQAAIRGDWARCKECTEQARKRGHEIDLQSMLFLARLGLGEHAALEREYRDKVAAAPANSFEPVVYLTSVLVSRGDPAAAKQVLDDWEKKFPPADRCGLAPAVSHPFGLDGRRLSSGRSPGGNRCRRPGVEVDMAAGEWPAC